MTIKTAVILAGGKGLRLNINTDIPKPMFIVGDKPILERIILLLKNLHFSDIYLVVGYKKNLIVDYFNDGSKFGLKLNYIENPSFDQKHKSGLSDAILLLKNTVKNRFMVILGDEIYLNTKHRGMLSEFQKDTDCSAMLAVHKTPNPEEIKKNYSLKLDPNNNIIDIEEKPQVLWNDLIGCGTYLFSDEIFSFLEQTVISERTGRKEIADTIKLMISRKKVVKAFEIGGKYININYPSDIEAAENILSWKK